MAQQINEVLPEAVTIEKDIIPSIYEVCDCSLNKVYIKDFSSLYRVSDSILDISENTKIDIIDLSGNRKTHIITEIIEKYITIHKEIEAAQCFVYCYEVDNFHTMDKS